MGVLRGRLCRQVDRNMFAPVQMRSWTCVQAEAAAALDPRAEPQHPWAGFTAVEV